MLDPSKKTYLSDIPFITNHFIYEYDISKANLNILFTKNMISKENYDIISQFGRGQREIYFGNLQRKNPEISQVLSDGLTEYRKRFIQDNNLNEMNVLSIKNDAFFIIDTIPKYTKYDNVEFKLKNTYTSYYHINKLEMYYYLDIINDREIIDIKGIDDKKLLLHQNYFISFLCSVFDSIQTGYIEESINIVNTFHEQYINKKLEYGFYREFNSDSLYRLSFPNGMQWLSIAIDNNSFEYLNIGNNLNIIRELYAIINIIYTKR